MYRGSSDGPGYVRIFRVVGSNQTPGYGGDPNYMEYRGDTLFTPQGNTIGLYHAIISDDVRISSILGIPNFKEERVPDNSFITEPPVQSEWSGGEDWKRYGSLLGLISHFTDHPLGIASREKQVSHPAFRGDVRDLMTSYYGYSDPPASVLYHGPTQLEYFSTYASPAYGRFQATGVNSRGFITFGLYQHGSLNNLHADYFHNLMRICDVATQGDVLVYPWTHWVYTYSNVINSSYKRGNFWHIGIEYDFKRNYNQGSGDLFATYHVVIDFDISVVECYGTNVASDVLTIVPESISSVSRNSVTLIDIGGVYTPNNAPIVPILIQPEQGVSAFSPVSQLDDSSLYSRFSIFRQYGSHNPNTLHRRVWFNANDLLPHLRPSSFYSASDALNKHVEILSANHLENLAQLDGLLRILPDLPKLPRLISRLTKRDPSAIVDTIDYVTDAIIKFRFAQNPTANDAIELATTNVLGELKSLLQSKTYTLYGHFHWEFPSSDNFMGDGRLTLDTRSKINITIDMTTLLANCLTANSMGVLPTLSRTWAVVPFSFVVDWFTNMDDRLEQIDNQLLWLAVRTNWALHSYKVTYYPSGSLLSSYGLEAPNSDEPFRISGYFRELSLILPLLRESRYDFLAPNRGPDPLTVGALTWQKLRS